MAFHSAIGLLLSLLLLLLLLLSSPALAQKTPIKIVKDHKAAGGGYNAYANTNTNQYTYGTPEPTLRAPVRAEPPPGLAPRSARGFAWLGLAGHCFEWHSDDGQNYIYSICPFRNVTQRREGAFGNDMHVVLGVWGRFKPRAPEDDVNAQDTASEASPLVLIFNDGKACASMAKRRTHVTVRCNTSASEPHLSHVREPETCKYEADLDWVGACPSFNPPPPPPTCEENLHACATRSLAMAECIRAFRGGGGNIEEVCRDFGAPVVSAEGG